MGNDTISSITNQILKAKYFCNRGRFSCSKVSVTIKTSRSSTGMNLEMQLVPCNDNSNTLSDECEALIHATAMCCPLDQLQTDTWMHPSREGAAKMCKGIEYGSQLANLWLKSNPRATLYTTEGRIKANEVQFFIYIPDHRFRRDTYRNSRHKRAVEQYWLSMQG